jgi:hypothetical protein
LIHFGRIRLTQGKQTSFRRELREPIANFVVGSGGMMQQHAARQRVHLYFVNPRNTRQSFANLREVGVLVSGRRELEPQAPVRLVYNVRGMNHGSVFLNGES